MTMCASIFLLIASSVERYLAVCRPHHYRQVRGHWAILNFFNCLHIFLDQRSALEGTCLHSPISWNGFPNEHYKVMESQNIRGWAALIFHCLIFKCPRPAPNMPPTPYTHTHTLYVLCWVLRTHIHNSDATSQYFF